MMHTQRTKNINKYFCQGFIVVNKVRILAMQKLTGKKFYKPLRKKNLNQKENFIIKYCSKKDQHCIFFLFKLLVLSLFVLIVHSVNGAAESENEIGREKKKYPHQEKTKKKWRDKQRMKKYRCEKQKNK